jgi:beta-lactamase regulating signal transducer with metallopeptidase domain
MTVVLAWLWQGMALTVAVWLLLTCTRRFNAATRHSVWAVTLIAVFALPFVLAAGDAHGEITSVMIVPRAADVAPQTMLLPAPPDWLVRTLIGAWLLTVLVAAGRLVRAAVGMERLRQSAILMAPARDLPGWKAAAAVGRVVRLCVSDQAEVPCAIGFRRPVILVPRSLADVLTDEHLDHVVLHEYAHLDRYDDWTRLGQLLIAAIAGLHPAVHVIMSRLDAERESACDDFVVARTGAHRYAACLAEVAAALSTRDCRLAPAGALTMMRTKSALSRRVARLVDTRRTGSAKPALATIALAIGLLTGAIVTLSRWEPLVAFAAQEAAPERDGLAQQSRAGDYVLLPEARAAATGLTLSPRRTGRPPRDPLASRIETAKADDANFPPAAVHVRSAAPSTPERPASTTAAHVMEAPAFLNARPLDEVDSRTVQAPAPRLDRAQSEAISWSPDGPWIKVAAAGAAVGAGSKRAGVSVAGFFSRTGKAISASF